MNVIDVGASAAAGSEPTIEEKAKQIHLTVKQEFDRDEPGCSSVFYQQAGDVFQQKEFGLRCAQVGRRLYLAMLENGGIEPGKRDIAEAVGHYTLGMDEPVKAMFIMCCYEACCEASIQFRMKGKMNAQLRQAADFPGKQAVDSRD